MFFAYRVVALAALTLPLLVVGLLACSDDSSSSGAGNAAGSGGAAGNNGSQSGSGGSGGSGGNDSLTVQYTSSLPVVKEVAWAAGQGVTVGVAGGNVRFGDTTTSITVNPHSSASSNRCTDVTKVCFVFTAINQGTTEERDEAIRQMKETANGGNLDFSAGLVGSAVTATVVRSAASGKFFPALSALVDVYVPTGFDGDVTANTTSGGVSVRGARRAATITTGLGDIAFELDGIAPGNSQGEITTGNGDILFTAPSTANISIQGDARGVGGSVLLSGSPVGWSQVQGSTDQAATFCGGTACATPAVSDGNWSLKTELGAIEIQLK
jgi:hypothetical protein